MCYIARSHAFQRAENSYGSAVSGKKTWLKYVDTGAGRWPLLTIGACEDLEEVILYVDGVASGATLDAMEPQGVILQATHAQPDGDQETDPEGR